jgi:transcriptional regulator with XRE-family HTH domain
VVALVKRDRPSPLRSVVAQNIRRLRAEREISQEELADRAELHRTNISKIERGLHAVSIDNLHWIARALGVDASDLLKAG